MFPRLTTLNIAVSSDIAAVTLPTRTPTVTPSILVPRKPAPARQFRAVSDAQVECSHADWPIRIQSVNLETPVSAPNTVMLADPDDAVLDLMMALIGTRSCEIVSDPVPVRIPTVNKSPLDPSAL